MKSQIEEQITRLQDKKERITAMPDTEAKAASLERINLSLSILQSQLRKAAPQPETKS